MLIDVARSVVSVALVSLTVWLVGRRNRRLFMEGQAKLRAELAELRVAQEERSGAWSAVNTLVGAALGGRDADVVPISRGRR